jgi:hypothetical protein
MSASSILVLPGAFDLGNPENFEMLDKLTLVLPSTGSLGATSRFALDDLEFDLEEAKATQSSGVVEMTGYPTLLDIA